MRRSRSISNLSTMSRSLALLAVGVSLTLLPLAAAHASPKVILKKGSEELPARVRIVDDVPVYDKVILSPVYTVDGIYKSMLGPLSVHNFRLGNVERPELLWLTGYDANMVGPDGDTSMSQEFMCHSNLLVHAKSYARRFPSKLTRNELRIFTLAQGQLSIRLPDGFGVPLMSNQTLNLSAQVLNHNHPDLQLEIRHRIAIQYVRDADLKEQPIPLFPIPITGFKLVDGKDGYFGVPEGEVDPDLHGAGCLPGDAVPHEKSRWSDQEGRVFTGHWVVKPGREENHTLITERLALPYDTTIHYVAAHLHPFATSISLYDLTDKKTVFESKARSTPDRIGLDEVEFFTSVEGLPVYKDHQYELISVYENTSEVDQDAMATLFLYVRDKDIESRLRSRRANSAAAVAP